MHVGNALGDAGDEFLDSEDLEIFLVAPMGHGEVIQHLATVFDTSNLQLSHMGKKPLVETGL